MPKSHQSIRISVFKQTLVPRYQICQSFKITIQIFRKQQLTAVNWDKTSLTLILDFVFLRRNLILAKLQRAPFNFTYIIGSFSSSWKIVDCVCIRSSERTKFSLKQNLQKRFDQYASLRPNLDTSKMPVKLSKLTVFCQLTCTPPQLISSYSVSTGQC